MQIAIVFKKIKTLVQEKKVKIDFEINVQSLKIGKYTYGLFIHIHVLGDASTIFISCS